MKRDLIHKTEKLGEHIPGFVGYGGAHYLETDLLLRRHLSGEVEKVRDRLADLLVNRKPGGAAGEALAQVLRNTALLKEALTLHPLGEKAPRSFSHRDEERLLDFDLALLEKVAGLYTPLEGLEAAGETEDLLRAMALFEEGLAEVARLVRKRRGILRGE